MSDDDSGQRWPIFLRCENFLPRVRRVPTIACLREPLNPAHMHEVTNSSRNSHAGRATQDHTHGGFE
jgi:hypothetical protein